MKETTTPAPFIWDGNHRNSEQVRPYYAGYLAVREQITARGAYPYNDSFKGQIPGIVGEREDTAIYMLQTMHALDALKCQIAEFRASGGIDPDTLEQGKTYRGTVAVYGFYMGGTGWQEYAGARLAQGGRGYVLTPKGKRNGLRTQGAVLIRLEGTR